MCAVIGFGSTWAYGSVLTGENASIGSEKNDGLDPCIRIRHSLFKGQSCHLTCLISIQQHLLLINPNEAAHSTKRTQATLSSCFIPACLHFTMPERKRFSLQYLQDQYDTGENRALLENLVTAFIGIQKLPLDDPNSFFVIGGYHGEPFRGPGVTDPNWWGGYCNHGNVLFPTWHRAHLLRLEDALRSIPGCQDVTIPFWDECFAPGNPKPIPAVLTSPTFPLKTGYVPNPLYAYKFPVELQDNVKGDDNRYNKPKGYVTVRYPQSGLVGTEQDRIATAKHNSIYSNPHTNSELLNGNVANWLNGTVQITPALGTRQPDTYSVLSRFKICLEAPNYTVFSNTTSAAAYIKEHGGSDPHYVVPLESPHNAIHLALGGFYQKGVYNTDPIPGANGDMGENNTAGLDPIFFFHHCFIDKVFWLWQERNGLTAPGSLSVIAGYPGTNSSDAGTQPTPDIPPHTHLDMTTPLHPFKKPTGALYTSYDVTDIKNQLGYTYGVSSLDSLTMAPALGAPDIAPITKMKRVRNINRAQYPGSFVVRTIATRPNGEEVEIGWDAILSRWGITGCANCQLTLDVESYVPIDTNLAAALRGPDGKDSDVTYKAVIHTHHDSALLAPPDGNDRSAPIVDDL